jgi:hypothetical protein
MQVEIPREPKCEEHGMRITHCLACCLRIDSGAAGLSEDDQHSWAVSNVYKAKGEW